MKIAMIVDRGYCIMAGGTEGDVNHRVVRSWLLDLLVDGLAKDPGLATVSGYAQDSGGGRWTVEEALARAVPPPAITAALFARFASRQQDSPAMRAIATLRNQFGGHAVRRP